MDDFFNKLNDLQDTLSNVLTPEILNEMTPEQKKVVVDGQNALKMKEGQSNIERIEELLKTMKDAKFQ